MNDDLSLIVDFYEFTMANAHYISGSSEKIAYFDMFFRTIPDDGGFCIMAGIEQLVDFLEQLSFAEENIDYLRKKSMFSPDFLNFLATIKNTCDIWAIPEGTPVFPGEPLCIVRGNIIFAQYIETMLLLSLNHQILIATKASRITRAAEGRPVMEFGTRRAHGVHAAILGARASYIGGCVGTSCTMAGKLFDIPVVGTMAHSWVMMFDSEYEAFLRYAEIYPDNCILLVDTYNVLKQGIPNAIHVFDDYLKPRGIRPKGIRIDSGDIAYLSIESRKMLDRAGYQDCAIIASNSLDEYIIRELFIQGAKIDSFGVGERLITSRSSPVFGGVYKLVAVEEKGVIIPKLKISENVAKITTPGFKNLYRIYDNENGKAIADLVTLHDETVEEPLTIFHPIHTWKSKTIRNFTAKKLLVPIFEKGKRVYDLPNIHQIQKFSKEEIGKLWETTLRFENPHNYYVDLSQKLWTMRDELLKSQQGKD